MAVIEGGGGEGKQRETGKEIGREKGVREGVRGREDVKEREGKGKVKRVVGKEREREYSS